MKKTVFLVAAIFLFSSAFAQDFNPVTQSDSISCNNNVCEEASLELNVGEQKSIKLGEKQFSIRLARIEVVPQTQDIGGKQETYYSFEIYLSVDGSGELSIQEAKQKLGVQDFYAQPTIVEVSQAGQPPSTPKAATLRFEEIKVCAVPDCFSSLEFNLKKRWNLVPAYFITGIENRIDETLKKGTCKPQDIMVVYAHDPIDKKYVRAYSFLSQSNNLERVFQSLTDKGNQNQALIGLPFNSVWVFAQNECTLRSEMPKFFIDNILLVFAAITEQYQSNNQPQPQFVSGWNFWMGSNDMQGKTFSEIKGTCTIEKAFSFDSETQSWKKLESPPGPTTGFLFKVTSPCLFGIPEIAPPEIPTGMFTLIRNIFG